MVTSNNRCELAEEIDCHKRIKILFLTLNHNLQGPLPKNNPLLIAAFEGFGCLVVRSSWGRHSDNENLFEKIFGRVEDVWKALVELVRMKPDILYVATTLDEHALVRDITLLLATCWSPTKKVLKMHGSKTDPLVKSGHGFYKFLTRILIRLSDAVLLLSTDEIQKWTSFEPNGRYYRVDDPFNVEEELVSSEMNTSKSQNNLCPILLFIGRLIQEKGIFELIDAMSIILRQVNCRLLIAGDGKERNEVLKRIDSLQLGENITLLGYLDSVGLHETYAKSSILILPSYREGFPRSIAEAMSSGLPIITTQVGGIPDHLLNGVNALFIKPRDPDAIVKAVVRLLNDPRLCLEMHFANLDKIKEFKPENVAPKYIEIFSELLGKDGVS